MSDFSIAYRSSWHRIALTGVCTVLLSWLLVSPTAGQDIDWPARLYDPATQERPADLVIPLPCDGALAFMKIDTPALAAAPLDDTQVRLGSDDASRAPFEFLNRAYIRGPFPSVERGTTHYFIGRYEVTADQFAAVMATGRGERCPEPDIEGVVLPASGISWFDAITFTRYLTEWLRAHAGDSLPAVAGKPGFVRLPSEVEWEFAARGGTAAQANGSFNARRFFPSGERMRAYGWHQGRRSSQGELKPIGQLAPNPLGLYDVYGNVSEMMFELFRLNKFGRRHGQVGGFVVRGGDYLTRAPDIGSSYRAEFSFYSTRAPEPLQLDGIGFRVMLTNVVTSSDALVDDIFQDWRDGADPLDADDPLALIDEFLRGETETARVDQLKTLRGLVLADRRARDDATALALRRTIYAGASFVQQLKGAMRRIKTVRERLLLREVDVQGYEQQLEADQASGVETDIARTKRLLDRARSRFENLQADLPKIERDLVLLENNFIATLESVFEVSTAPSLQTETERLIIDLGNSEQNSFALYVQDFSQDVEEYRKNPDMGRNEIIKLTQ